VDYNTKKAEIEFDDAVINDDGIAKAVNELGYKIKPES
jgi:copper chaperone CopZ